MSILKLIVIFQLLLALTCFLLQLYALFSQKWGIFESRVELGLVEEHGHFGLWLICTNKFIPAEVDEEGRIIQDIHDCDPMDTFFKPTHSRAFIAFFSICHTIALFGYICLLSMKMVDLFVRNSNRSHESGDIEINQNQTKRILIIASRFVIANNSSLTSDEQTKQQIKVKLYTISIAAAATSLALLSAIAPRRPLRETDLFQINNVSANNYRTWRGPGFWAQLTTLIMDMLITSLIAIEVRVIFVLHQQQQTITTSCSTNDNLNGRLNNGDHHRSHHNHHQQQQDIEIIINPFQNTIVPQSTNIVRSSSGNNVPNRHQQHRSHPHNHCNNIHTAIPLTTHREEPTIVESEISMQNTRPKMIMDNNVNSSSPSSESPSSPSSSSSSSKVNTNHYVNSNDVRKLKKIMHLQRKQQQQQQQQQLQQPHCSSEGTTAYCNPMFCEMVDDNNGDNNGDGDQDDDDDDRPVNNLNSSKC